MVTQENEPIFKRSDESYVLRHGGGEYGVNKDDENCAYPYSQIVAYLASLSEKDRKRALISEPKPPEPSAEEKAARKAREDEAKEAELDLKWALKWAREQRKKAEKNGGK